MVRRGLALALILLGSFACSEEQRVTLEFRIAEDEASPGLTEAVFGPARVRFYLHNEVLLDESDVDSAHVTTQGGRPAVEVLFTSAGSQKWEELTERNVGKRCGMILNGNLVSAPRIMAPIRVGRAIVAGDFTEAEARRVAQRLGKP
jgi:preprotein translocase subunit SecD